LLITVGTLIRTTSPIQGERITKGEENRKTKGTTAVLVAHPDCIIIPDRKALSSSEDKD
jgi:hypothetical protein